MSLVDVSSCLDFPEQPRNRTHIATEGLTDVSNACSGNIVFALSDDALGHTGILCTTVEAEVGAIVIRHCGGSRTARATARENTRSDVVEARAKPRLPLISACQQASATN